MQPPKGRSCVKINEYTTFEPRLFWSALLYTTIGFGLGFLLGTCPARAQAQEQQVGIYLSSNHTVVTIPLMEGRILIDVWWVARGRVLLDVLVWPNEGSSSVSEAPMIVTPPPPSPKPTLPDPEL